MKNIVEIASGNENFTTLVAAVVAAGLAETLSGTGPFTVFAPTNEAFAKLPAGTVEELIKPENKAKLAAILTYHVVAGKALSSDLSDGQLVETVNGQKVTVSIGDNVKVDGAVVTSANLEASNGVIHVIDSVILPK
ncbi:fasciclin domain-containing protein [soil metagenome]